MADDRRTDSYPNRPQTPLDMSSADDVPTVYDTNTTVLSPADPDTFIPWYPGGEPPQLALPDTVLRASSATPDTAVTLVAEAPADQIHVEWQTRIKQDGTIELPQGLDYDLNLAPGDRFVLKVGALND